MNSKEVKERIESNLKGQCLVTEFSGGDDHYSVIVVSDEFKGETALKRHRKVFDLFQNEIESGEVHALSIQAYTQEQWKEKK